MRPLMRFHRIAQRWHDVLICSNDIIGRDGRENVLPSPMEKERGSPQSSPCSPQRLESANW
jgi:hypothetical protein